jgi:hypothetical protein
MTTGSTPFVDTHVGKLLRGPTPLPKQLVYVPGTVRVNLAVLGRPPHGRAIKTDLLASGEEPDDDGHHHQGQH